MRISDKAIVLQSVKRSDNKYILSIFTREHGQLSVSAVVSRSPKARIRQGHVLPLSFLQAEIFFKQNREVHTLTETSCYFTNAGISSSLQKLGVAQFINELLIKCLRNQHTNAYLFDFIETCWRYLNDSDENYLNMPVYFMKELCVYLGIEPQNNFNRKTIFFDCREGSFSAVSLPPPLGFNSPESALFSAFLGEGKLDTPLSNSQRRTIAEILIAYYKLHIPGFNELKCYTVLQEVFNG